MSAWTPSRRVVFVLLCGGGALACRTPPEPGTFDVCDRNPPDSVAPPAFAVRASADSSGVIFVDPRTSGRHYTMVAILDSTGRVMYTGPGRFGGVSPGQHRLRGRSFGYGERDTVVTLPPDSSLHVSVMLTPGGGIRRCSTYEVIDKE